MTEQIITKNFYSLLAAGGDADGNTIYTCLMPTTLSRFYTQINNSSAGTIFSSLRSFNSSYTNNCYFLYPVKYSKLLSGLTENEIYSVPYESIMTNGLTRNNYPITDSSTNMNSGVKLVTTYTNSGNSNTIINGVLLRGYDNSRYYNLILTKFDGDITVAPTESCQFTLDLDNLFQTFPATIGS